MRTSNFATLVQNFNQHYPAFLRFLVGLSEVLYTTSQTVIVSFGVPLVLLFLMVVEHSRVMHGIALFEQDSSLASFAAWALVLLNLVLEFTVHHIEHKEGYQHQIEQRDSLRLRWRSARYWLGIGQAWQAESLSPAHRYQRLLKLVTFTILALALAGSMQASIIQQNGAWYRALLAIATESTLAEMTTWLGGLLFAFAAVRGAQGLTAYLAVRVQEITTSMQAISSEEKMAAGPFPGTEEEDTKPVETVSVEVLEDSPLVEEKPTARRQKRK